MSHDEPTLGRRDFMKFSALTATASIIPKTPLEENGPLSVDKPVKFKTPVCDLLGIQYPIFQAGMGGVAGPELVAAVSSAGGLGILTATLLPVDELRSRIQQVKKLTNKPFGVNFILHNDLLEPKDTSFIPDDILQQVHGLLNRLRGILNLPEKNFRPPTLPQTLQKLFEIVIEEKVRVLSTGLGLPPPYMVEACRKNGIKIISMVSTVDDALIAEQTGVDIIVAQGSEAGGHRSVAEKPSEYDKASIGGMALIPQIVSRVKSPVLAAGGINNGKGLLAALALGAQGALIGTRFIPCRESIAPEFHKEAVASGNNDHTTITDCFTGMYARVIRNRFTEEYRNASAPVLPPFSQFLVADDIITQAVVSQNADFYALYAGQGIGAVNARSSASDVVQQIILEARQELKSLNHRVVVQ